MYNTRALQFPDTVCDINIPQSGKSIAGTFVTRQRRVAKIEVARFQL